LLRNNAIPCRFFSVVGSSFDANDREFFLLNDWWRHRTSQQGRKRFNKNQHAGSAEINISSRAVHLERLVSSDSFLAIHGVKPKLASASDGRLKTI
jgi:hypothetical protein